MVNLDPEVKQLLADLRDFNKERRRKAVYKLGMLGGEEALRALMGAVEDDNEDLIVRGRAAQMLGKIKDTRAVESLILALRARGYKTPIYAAQALGRIGDKRAIDPLLNIADYHPNASTRQAAHNALASLGYEFMNVKSETESQNEPEPEH
jgi:HEAT repeat protein